MFRFDIANSTLQMLVCSVTVAQKNAFKEDKFF